MITRHLLSSLMLTVFAWVSAGPTVASALELSDPSHASPPKHEAGVPCPDHGDEGPCDSGCPCICCPDHATVILSPAVVYLETLNLTSFYRFSPPESDKPKGIHHRVFRPPRV